MTFLQGLLNLELVGWLENSNRMEHSPLDPSLPGVRLLQGWIREQLPISIDLASNERIEGRLIWQDPEFLAIERPGAERPILISRGHVAVIRSLG